MLCNFGCRCGFFGIGVGRVPENLSCMMHNHNCCACRCAQRCECDDCGNSNRSC